MWWVEEGSPRVEAKRRGGDSLPPGPVQSQISGSERAAGVRLESSAHRRMARRTPETNNRRCRSVGGRGAGGSQVRAPMWSGHARSPMECEHELGADADDRESSQAIVQLALRACLLLRENERAWHRPILTLARSPARASGRCSSSGRVRLPWFYRAVGPAGGSSGSPAGAVRLHRPSRRPEGRGPRTGRDA
jgi:hypothetical protein